MFGIGDLTGFKFNGLAIFRSNGRFSKMSDFGRGAVKQNATKWWVDFRWMYKFYLDYDHLLDVLVQM